MKVDDMRSLSRAAKHARRVQVIGLRKAGVGYAQIARQTGLSRTGVFDICRRHQALGPQALDDACREPSSGAGRRLDGPQESQMRRLIAHCTPAELDLPGALWTRLAVSQLVEQRLGLTLPVRTLASYLSRWGYAALPTRSHAWLAGNAPGFVAACQAQDGELRGCGCRELPERGLSVLGSRNRRGQLRWTTFAGALKAQTLIDFLGRLIGDAHKKVFLVIDDLRTADGPAVACWLAEHEDAIQVLEWQAPGACGVPGSS
jgi:transposase